MVIELLTLSTYQVEIRQNYHTQHFLYPEIRYVLVFERETEREREGERERGEEERKQGGNDPFNKRKKRLLEHL